MAVEQTQIQRIDVDSFAIPIGSRIIIEPDGFGEKLKTYFIGMERRSYFIVSLAPVVGEDKLAYDYLYKGNRTKIFYTQDGIINGFISEVLLYTTSPFRHIYFTYPTDAEICNLRHAKRTDCHLPSMVSVNGNEYPGMILNISSSGCGLCLRLKDDNMARALEVGAEVVVRFYLVKSMREFSVRCELKNKRVTGKRIVLGMSFAEIDETTQKRVNEFIGWVTSYKI